MMNVLFLEWMRHFLLKVSENYGISSTQRHLLILDGHKSHVSFEVIQVAKSNGLDLLSFPSHTSHAMQPLDVTCFKPFKFAFRAYKDKWTVDHIGESPVKEDIAQWISFSLKKALSPENIKCDFAVIGIYPICPSAMDARMGPSKVYDIHNSAVEPLSAGENVMDSSLEIWEVEDIVDDIRIDIAECTQYYVEVESCSERNSQPQNDDNCNDEQVSAKEAQGTVSGGPAVGTSGRQEVILEDISKLLALPRVRVGGVRRRTS